MMYTLVNYKIYVIHEKRQVKWFVKGSQIMYVQIVVIDVDCKTTL